MKNNKPMQLEKPPHEKNSAKSGSEKTRFLQPTLSAKNHRADAASTRGANCFLFFSALHLAALMLLWVLENFVGERDRWTAFLLYLPQQGLIFVPLLLLILTARRQFQQQRASTRDVVSSRKSRRAMGVLWLFNIAAAALVWFGFLGFNLPLASRAAPPNALRLRTMTFNVHLGISGAARIVEAIQHEKADIVCLQETRALGVHRDIVPQLKTLLPKWHFARAGEVTTLSRLPILKSRAYPIRNMERVILETQIVARGRRISVYNTHFVTDRVRPKNAAREINLLGGSASLRLHQMRQLQRVVPQNAPRVLVMSDFNNPPRGLLYRRLASRWTDAFRAAGFGFGYTFRSDLPLMRIDYIWTSRDLRVLAAHVSRQRASDHRAVVAEISLS